VCSGLRLPSAALLAQLDALYESLADSCEQLTLMPLLDWKLIENEERFRGYIQKVNDMTANYRHQVVNAWETQEEPSEEVKAQIRAQAFDRWKVTRPEGLKEVMVERDTEIHSAIVPSTPIHPGKTGRYTGYHGHNPRSSDSVIEPMLPKISEEAQLIQIHE